MKNILSNRIKELRKKRGLTQGELAERIGVHVQTLSRYERRINEIPADVLIKIFEELQPNSGWLLSGKGEMFIEKCEECEITGVAEASAPYGLTPKGREILALLRENPGDEDLILRLLKGKKAVKESLEGLQGDPDPSEAQD
jgi:transcriptional regulator with XRE-family HTH domain